MDAFFGGGTLGARPPNHAPLIFLVPRLFFIVNLVKVKFLTASHAMLTVFKNPL
jgi:hypothetical protein